MNRRRFLQAISAAVGAFALDPERALWVPGQRTHFDMGSAPSQELTHIRLYPDASSHGFYFYGTLDIGRPWQGLEGFDNALELPLDITGDFEVTGTWEPLHVSRSAVRKLDTLAVPRGGEKSRKVDTPNRARSRVDTNPKSNVFL